MGYQVNELFNTTPGNSVYRVTPEYVQAKTIAPLSGSPVLPVLTPMAFQTNLGADGQWVPWSAGGSNGANSIKGFLWPGGLDGAGTPSGSVSGVQTDAVLWTLAQILMKGVIHHDDIPVPTGESQANLDIALRTGLRAYGLMIQGLEGVN